jgi:hypothetical protein
MQAQRRWAVLVINAGHLHGLRPFPSLKVGLVDEECALGKVTRQTELGWSSFHKRRFTSVYWKEAYLPPLKIPSNGESFMTASLGSTNWKSALLKSGDDIFACVTSVRARQDQHIARLRAGNAYFC